MTDIKINQKVYGIIYDDGDIQIVPYKVGYIGENAFLPKDFYNYRERFLPVRFEDCFATIGEAEKEVVNRYFHGNFSECMFDEDSRGIVDVFTT